MILTGKCKEDFIKYASYNYGEDSGDLAMLRSVMRNALIIEFFDSVGIEIYIYPIGGIIGYQIKSENRDIESKEGSRQEATTEAIKKANEIYNAGSL